MSIVVELREWKIYLWVEIYLRYLLLVILHVFVVISSPRRNTLLAILQQPIPKILSITQPVIEYFDDEEDYCILRDDEQAFLEMLNCAKEIEGHTNRLKLRITEAYSPTDTRHACEIKRNSVDHLKPLLESSHLIRHSKKKLTYGGEPGDEKSVQKAPEEKREIISKTTSTLDES